MPGEVLVRFKEGVDLIQGESVLRVLRAPMVVVAVVDSALTTTDGSFNFRIWTGTTFQTFGVPIARTADFDHARVDVNYLSAA